MPTYTIHIKIETDVNVTAEDRDQAIELAGQLELGQFISRDNATVTAVMEDVAAEIPDENPDEGPDANPGGEK